MSRGLRRASHQSVPTSDYLPPARLELRQGRGGQRDALWPSLGLTGLRITPPSAQQTLLSLSFSLSHHTKTPNPHPSLRHSLFLTPSPCRAALISSFTNTHKDTHAVINDMLHTLRTPVGTHMQINTSGLFEICTATQITPGDTKWGCSQFDLTIKVRGKEGLWISA